MSLMSQLGTDRLGAQVVDGGTVFRVYAPSAKRVQLTLVDTLNTQSHLEMESLHDGTWRLFVPGVGHQQRYGYRVQGPWDPLNGHHFNPAKLLIDPRARAIAGGIDYRGPIHGHMSHDPTERDPEDSFGSVPLSVVVEDTPPPEPIRERKRMVDSVIYELHVRGFTRTNPLVPEHLRGTYAGLAYPDVIDYLKDLGVTAVQLLPVHHFTSEPFVALKGLTNYWGYNTLGFFAPHAAYAQRGGVSNQVQEFKEMVTALHRADLEVILDVVYNHTAEGGQKGPMLSFRGIANDVFYRLTNDRREDYDVTGCGNSVDTSHHAVGNLVLDSMRYWVTEMGVDGFRFDLATALVRDHQHHVDLHHPLKQAIDGDEVFQDVKMIAEPWDVGPWGYQVGAWGPGWSEWNDRFRDHTRDYWRSHVHGVRELATRLSGSGDLFDKPGRGPAASINFVTAHDGFTMHDLVSYDVKHNQANDESNRDGTDNNRSWNHGWEGPTDDPAINALRARQVLNLFATMLLSVGTPMITAGDEFGRTQRGNNNAYCHDSPLTWVNWDFDQRWDTVRGRVRDLLRLRADHRLLRPERFLYHQEVRDAHGESLQRVDLTWMDGTNGQMGEMAWHDGARRLLGMYRSDETEAWLVWFNSSPDPIGISLPKPPWGSGFQVVWHSAGSDEVPQDKLAAGAAMTVPGRSVILMKVDVPATAAELHELERILRESGQR